MCELRCINYIDTSFHKCTQVYNMRSGIVAPVAAMLTLIWVNGCSVSALDIANVNQWRIPQSLAKEPKTSTVAPAKNLYSYKVNGKRYWVKAVAVGYRESGIASWYGKKFHGRLTANQEVYDMYKLTAAHKSLPLPSYIKVYNHNNNKSVTVKVNDRGPFVEGRIVDLSYAAAQRLGMARSGLAPVTIEVIAIPDSRESGHVKVSATTNKSLVSYIHVDNYQDIANAFSTMRLLKEHRLTPSLSRDSVQDIYWISVGPFNTASELEMVGRLLDREGFKHYKIFYR